jgi:hypothetical protein
MHSKRILVAALMTVASALAAQPTRLGGPPMGITGFGGLATLLIDARRELDLTPKQLLALDSVERADFAQRRDSLCANRRPCELTTEERQHFFGGTAGIEGRIRERLRADSARRMRIVGMLDTTQRRLADRIAYRQRVDRMARGVGGPSRDHMRGERMRGYGPRFRNFRGGGGRREWDGPRGFRDDRERVMRPDHRRDDVNDSDLDDGDDRQIGPEPERGWWSDRRAGPLPRRRPRGDTETFSDTTVR